MSTTHIDAVGYALHAVDELEQARSERHLQNCEECRTEVDEISEITATLALDAPAVTPSASVRDNLLTQIQQTPQQTRVDTSAAREHSRGSKSLRVRRSVIGLVAAAAVVVGVTGVIKAQPWANSSSGVTNAEARIERAPDAVRKTAPFRGGTITVVMSRSLNQAVAVLDKVPSAGGQSSYQGWYIKSDGPTNAGLLKPGKQNVLTSKLTGASEFDITIEPAGGSTVPTSKAVLAISMT